uniref:Uncharacterized protein n=1 Tax=viral metagenome TaxID=1070528 RepID=A0A6C0HN30_9ZZZZ
MDVTMSATMSALVDITVDSYNIGKLNFEDQQELELSTKSMLTLKASEYPYEKYQLLKTLAEQEVERKELEYHTVKSTGIWKLAKLIIARENVDTPPQQGTSTVSKVFYFDYLEKQMQAANDSFENIIYLYYKSYSVTGDMLHVFDKPVAQYIVENLKIDEYRPNGLIFNADNSWDFQVTVITSKGVYCANRYVTRDIIGMY